MTLEYCDDYADAMRLKTCNRDHAQARLKKSIRGDHCVNYFLCGSSPRFVRVTQAPSRDAVRKKSPYEPRLAIKPSSRFDDRIKLITHFSTFSQLSLGVVCAEAKMWRYAEAKARDTTIWCVEVEGARAAARKAARMEEGVVGGGRNRVGGAGGG
jgi:hypothetical protein